MIAATVLSSGFDKKLAPRKRACETSSSCDAEHDTFIIHRLTVTKFRYISIPAGFRRHLVGKTLRNVSYSAVT